MPGDIEIIEATGPASLPAAADFAVCVIGCATSNPLPGLVSPPYSSPSVFVSAYGIGDGVDCVTQAITKTQGNPAPPSVCFYRTPATTPGVRGTLDVSGVTGTAVITQTAATYPVGTYQPLVRVKDDGNSGDGGLIGTAGIVLEASLNNGDTWLPAEQLGTAFTFKIRVLIDGSYVDTGVQYDIAPSTTNANYVALAVELRADTLAHLANAVAHDGADTNAGQVALAASSVPATVTASTAVVNLVLTALQLHVVNITSVHDGPDLVADTALDALVAATDTRTGIDLAIALKSILNAHMLLSAVDLPAAAAGLKAATATVAAPVTVTAAELLAGGTAAILAQPRRITFTTAGVTPSDAPATVDIVGTDLDGAAQSETGLALAQTATSVTSTKAFKTITTISYPAADGTDATIAIGYSNGVHNSDDVTNTITAADPTYGTLFTDDVWGESKTLPPQWAVADIYTAGSPATGAFAAVAKSATALAILVLSEPVAAGDWSTIVAGLNFLNSAAGGNKRVALLCRFRDPTAGESDADYVTAFQTFAATHHDDRVTMCVGSGWLTDAYRGGRYLRSGLPAVLARLQSNAVIPGARGEKMAQHPGWGARGPLENFSVVDDDGNPLDSAHDERILGGVDGPIAGNGGGLAFFYERTAGIAGTYVSQAPTLYQGGSKILTWMDRRVVNGIETVLRLALWSEIQGADIVTGTTLDDGIREAIAMKSSKAIRDRYEREFANPSDPNLCEVEPTVTKDGSSITIYETITPLLYFYTDRIRLTINASRD